MPFAVTAMSTAVSVVSFDPLFFDNGCPSTVLLAADSKHVEDTFKAGLETTAEAYENEESQAKQDTDNNACNCSG